MTIFRKAHLAVLIVLAALTAAPGAQAQLGVAVGANFNSLGDIKAGDRTATFDRATGFHVGLFYDTSFGPLALRPGLFYMDVGDFSTDDVEAGNIDVDPGDAKSVDLSLVEVPIDVRFRLATLPILKPYLTAGPVFRYNTSGSDNTESADFSMAGNVGLGLEVDLPGPGLRFFPEILYSFGVTRFVDEYQIAGQTIAADDGGNLNTIMLRLGVGL